MKKNLLVPGVVLLALLAIGGYRVFSSRPAPQPSGNTSPSLPTPEAPVGKAPATEAPSVEVPATKAAPEKQELVPIKPTEWRTDYDSALKEARRSGKPMFVDFYTDWCSACKYLDANGYRDPQFVRASHDWVMVKINAEKGARNVQLAQHFQVSGYPTLLMLDGKGKQLGLIPGAPPTPMLLDEMQKAQSKMGVLSAQLAPMRRAG